jgi:hypothetical protein
MVGRRLYLNWTGGRGPGPRWRGGARDGAALLRQEIKPKYKWLSLCNSTITNLVAPPLFILIGGRITCHLGWFQRVAVAPALGH